MSSPHSSFTPSNLTPSNRNESVGHPTLHPDDQAPEGVHDSGLHELMSPEQNVQRIMWTGTAWFGVVVGSTALVMAVLLGSGWRPSVLPVALGALWWFGSVLVALSIGLIGWSGCPILEVSVPIADRNKTRTMQLGTLLFIVGGVLSLVAIVLGPAH